MAASLQGREPVSLMSGRSSDRVMPVIDCSANVDRKLARMKAASPFRVVLIRS
jgi:hypothetical protein